MRRADVSIRMHRVRHPARGRAEVHRRRVDPVPHLRWQVAQTLLLGRHRLQGLRLLPDRQSKRCEGLSGRRWVGVRVVGFRLHRGERGVEQFRRVGRLGRLGRFCWFCWFCRFWVEASGPRHIRHARHRGQAGREVRRDRVERCEVGRCEVRQREVRRREVRRRDQAQQRRRVEGSRNDVSRSPSERPSSCAVLHRPAQRSSRRPPRARADAE
jgi:hypothetical protein